MKSGTIIKNGDTTFFVLGVEGNKALLCRQNDCETVVAVDFKQTGIDVTGIPTMEWNWGHYYGNYMNNVLHMLEGLKQYQPPETVYVKTSRERAEFLASLGDETYESGLAAFAADEAVCRVDRFIPEMLEDATEAQRAEIHEWAEKQLYAYLLEDENAINYDEMDDITVNTIAGYITELDAEMDRD